MNKKGFAATGILYTILVLFVLLIFGMITMLYSRNNILNKIQNEVKGNIQKPINLNLILNGDLSFGDNTNFVSFTYGEDSDGSYLSYSGDSVATIYSGEFITVDPNNKYTMAMDLKSNGTSAGFYIGLLEYDIDQKVIVAQNYMYIDGSTTVLTQDLEKGDTVVYLQDVSGFNVTSVTPYYQRGFIFWNYTDSTGYTYPAETYSRNYIWDAYEYGSIDTTNNTITLKTAWTGDTISAGTKLSQSSSGGVYNYLILSGKTLSTEWTSYSGSIAGINYSGLYDATKFRPATRYVKPFFWFNYNNTSSTTLYVKNMSLKKVETTS